MSTVLLYSFTSDGVVWTQDFFVAYTVPSILRSLSGKGCLPQMPEVSLQNFLVVVLSQFASISSTRNQNEDLFGKAMNS